MTDPAQDDSNGGEDFAALLAQSETAEKSHRRIRTGDLVRGRVVALGAQSAFVAIGAKAEAVIDLERCTRCDECVRACADAHDGEAVLNPVTKLVRDGRPFDSRAASE
jgi:exosome complex RNA-binding protein Csl4